MVAVLQYTTIMKIGAQRAQRSLFAQPSTSPYDNREKIYVVIKLFEPKSGKP